MNQKGFTLVELAIVLVVIGLLIGGVLAGKELMENASIDQTVKQIQSYNSAIMTFRDQYKALPGDFKYPSTRLANCSTAPCNVAGNGNRQIGPTGSWSTSVSSETNTMWLHLMADGLISGVDMSKSTYQIISLPMGAELTMTYYDSAANSYYLDGLYGHYWTFWITTVGSSSIPVSLLGKLDAKIDDGKPWGGNFVLGSSGCNVTAAATSYGTNNRTLCLGIYQAGF